MTDHAYCREAAAAARESMRPYIEDLGRALFVCRQYIEAVEAAQTQTEVGPGKLDPRDDYVLEVARELLARQEAREAAVLAAADVVNARRDAEDHAEVATDVDDQDDEGERLRRLSDVINPDDSQWRTPPMLMDPAERARIDAQSPIVGRLTTDDTPTE